MEKALKWGRLFLLIFCLSACANTDVLPHVNYNTDKDTALIQKTTEELNISKEDIANLDKLAIPVNSDINSISSKTQESEEENIKVVSKIYTIKHTKNESSYFVILQEDEIPLAIAYPNLINDPVYKNVKSTASSRNHLVRLLDAKGHQLQMITLEDSIFGGISFEDLNFDGYMDFVINTGGTINETHDLYTWDSSLNNFSKVIYEGFDMLAWFTPHQGYIENFIRGDSPETSIKQKLIWKGNTLIKESEDWYELED